MSPLAAGRLRFEPVTPAGLVTRLADAAQQLSRAAAARAVPHGVRVGVDSAVSDDGGPQADAVAAELRARAVPVVRVRQSGFVRPRSVRLEHGADDPDAEWERWWDDAGLRREVLDPLGPGGRMTWVPSLWDVDADRASRASRELAAPGTVVVVDGRFLLRWELAEAFDLVLHLQTSSAAQARRVDAVVERARVLPSWLRYLEEADPVTRVLDSRPPGLVARYEDPRHPALVLRGT